MCHYIFNICFAGTNLDDHPHNDLRKAFDFLLARPGPGHIEINMARVLLEYLWYPVAANVAKALGFRTPRALEVVKKGTDHHRSKQIISVLLHSLASELLLPYVRQSENPTADDYFRWLHSVENSGYIFYFHMTFTCLFSFQLYIEGTRKNHSTAMMAARTAFTPLFYGKAHPKYQELLLRDQVMRVQAPPEIKEYLHNTEAFTHGDILSGQGADFVKEENIRATKSFLPPGIISKETWVRICRKTDKYKKIREDLLSASHIGSGKSARRYRRHDLEVTMTRCMIREQALFVNPSVVGPPMSVSGEELDASVENVRELTRSNYHEYKQEVAKYNEFKRIKLVPVCLTQEERQKSNNIKMKTKEQILEEVTILVSTMVDETVKEMYEDQCKHLKSKYEKNKSSVKKDDCLALYDDAFESIQSQYANATNDQDATQNDDLDYID